jgi:hypothetical protein
LFRPSLRQPSRTAAKPSTDKPLAGKSPPTKPFPGERQLPSAHEGTPVPDSKGELPPVIRRTEGGRDRPRRPAHHHASSPLYLAKAFFPADDDGFHRWHHAVAAASFLERHGISSLACPPCCSWQLPGAGFTFMIA